MAIRSKPPLIQTDIKQGWIEAALALGIVLSLWWTLTFGVIGVAFDFIISLQLAGGGVGLLIICLAAAYFVDAFVETA